MSIGTQHIKLHFRPFLKVLKDFKKKLFRAILKRKEFKKEDIVFSELQSDANYFLNINMLSFVHFDDVTFKNEQILQVDVCKSNVPVLVTFKNNKLLNKAMVCFYVTIALLLTPGINNIYNVSTYLGILAIVISTFGFVSLIIYSIKSVNIHQNQFKTRSI